MASLDKAKTRRRHTALARAAMRRTEKLTLAFSSEHTPCGCAPHTRCGIPVTPVAWTVEKRTWRYRLRCLTCGCAWTRGVPSRPRPDADTNRTPMLLHSQHPEGR